MIFNNKLQSAGKTVALGLLILNALAAGSWASIAQFVSATPDLWRPRLRPPAPAKISNDRKGWPIFGRAPSSLVDSSLGKVSSSLEDFFPFPFPPPFPPFLHFDEVWPYVSALDGKSLVISLVF